MAAAIRISLEVKAEPALIDAIVALATALGVVLPAQATVSVPASSPEMPTAPSPVPKPAASLVHIAPPPPAAPLVLLPPVAAPAPAGTTLGQVRDAAKLLNDKGTPGAGRPALVALLAAHGAQSLANLDEARYGDFVAAALAQAQA